MAREMLYAVGRIKPMASPFKKVLCAADFDENCAATIRAARGLLGPDGHLYVFHAVTFPFALTRKEAEVLGIELAVEALSRAVRSRFDARDDRVEAGAR
jgi:hypothetical protein